MRIGVEQSQNRRHVPLGIKLLVLFGGENAQMGWLVLGFLTLYLWHVVPATEAVSLLAFQRPLRVTEAEVTGWRDTFTPNQRRATTYGVSYTYEVGHNQYRAESYAEDRYLESGEVVTVEYVPGQPALSRIKGFRHSVMGPEHLITVLCFICLALARFLPALVSGARAIQLLQVGHVGEGRYHRHETVTRRYPWQSKYRVLIEFITPSGQKHYLSGYTTSFKPEWEQEDTVEQVLFHPASPARAIVPHCLPGMPTIDEEGQINTSAALDGYVVIIIPAVVVLGHLGMALSRLFMG